MSHDCFADLLLYYTFAWMMSLQKRVFTFLQKLLGGSLPHLPRRTSPFAPLPGVPPQRGPLRISGGSGKVNTRTAKPGWLEAPLPFGGGRRKQFKVVPVEEAGEFHTGDMNSTQVTSSSRSSCGMVSIYLFGNLSRSSPCWNTSFPGPSSKEPRILPGRSAG